MPPRNEKAMAAVRRAGLGLYTFFASVNLIPQNQVDHVNTTIQL